MSTAGLTVWIDEDDDEFEECVAADEGKWTGCRVGFEEKSWVGKEERLQKMKTEVETQGGDVFDMPFQSLCTHIISGVLSSSLPRRIGYAKPGGEPSEDDTSLEALIWRYGDIRDADGEWERQEGPLLVPAAWVYEAQGLIKDAEVPLGAFFGVIDGLPSCSFVPSVVSSAASSPTGSSTASSPPPLDLVSTSTSSSPSPSASPPASSSASTSASTSPDAETASASPAADASTVEESVNELDDLADAVAQMLRLNMPVPDIQPEHICCFVRHVVHLSMWVPDEEADGTLKDFRQGQLVRIVGYMTTCPNLRPKWPSPTQMWALYEPAFRAAVPQLGPYVYN